VVLLTVEDAVAVKVAVVEPSGTMTLAGTGSALVLFELRETRAPPVGAAAFSVTVPVVEAPGAIEVGLKERPVTPSVGVTVKLSGADVAPDVSGLLTVMGNTPGTPKSIART
jgi:hypothetical protein